MFPIYLNLQDRLAVVVGGGAVGRRKVAALLAGGVRVRVVCLESRPADCPEAVDWRTTAYGPGQLEGTTLVLAAATATVNRQVIADARRLGLWVNSATEPAEADFFLPSVLRRGQLTVAVGTGGTAPALARAVRLLLENQFDEAFASWAELLAELRPLIQQRVVDPRQRKLLVDNLCHWEWLERLRREETAQVREAMLAAIGLSQGLDLKQPAD